MIFIDTGAFIARYLTQDAHHSNALKIWEQIEKSNLRCFTSNFVLDETFTLLGRWASYPFSVEKARIIFSSTRLTILRPNEEDEIQALHYFEKYSDQKISYTDCISFVLLKNQKINQVFSFDNHFAIVGYKNLQNFTKW